MATERLLTPVRIASFALLFGGCAGQCGHTPQPAEPAAAPAELETTPSREKVQAAAPASPAPVQQAPERERRIEMEGGETQDAAKSAPDLSDEARAAPPSPGVKKGDETFGKNGDTAGRAKK